MSVTNCTVCNKPRILHAEPGTISPEMLESWKLPSSSAYRAWVEEYMGEEDENGEREYGYNLGERLTETRARQLGIKREAYEVGIAP